MHTYGCRVIQKVLQVSAYKDQKKIVDYILDPYQFDILILDQFGNYLIQSILEMSKQPQSKQTQKLYD